MSRSAHAEVIGLMFLPEPDEFVAGKMAANSPMRQDSRNASQAPAPLKHPVTLLAIMLLAAWTYLAANALKNDILPNDQTLALVRKQFGEQALERLQRWRVLLDRDLVGVSEQAKLEQVNRFFNQIPGVDDQTNWNQRDYWATPVELLVRNGGDCEDYALAKYFTLKAAGIPDDRLRITYVRIWLAREKKVESHMVLAYYPHPESEPLILDNIDPRIRPAAERSDLVPGMSFNGDGLWSAKQRGQNGRIGETSSIQHWNNLLARMRHDR